MSVCRQCGSALAADERFCGECGTPAATANPPAEAPAMTPPPPPPLAEPQPPVEPPPPVGRPLASAESATPVPADAAPHTRPTAMYVGGAVAVFVLLVAGLWWTGRSDDNTSVGSDPVASADLGAAGQTTVAPTTASPATTAPTTTVPDTTAPETTAAPDTAPPTTPTVAVPAGWRPGELILEAQLPPGFDSPWAGSPSPLIEPGADLADGVYWANYTSQDGASLTLALGRYESCSILNDEFACGPAPYGSNAIGRVEPAAGEVTIPLDDTVRIVIEGRECEPVVLEGNGADLAQLYGALAADYGRAFTDGINAGTDPYDLMVAARNDPTTGFRAPPAECDDGYSLVWQSAGGPPLFVQQVVDFETGGAMDPAMLLTPTAIELSGDQVTVYFFAGFLS